MTSSARWATPSRVARTALSGVLDFVLPRICVSCGQPLHARDDGVICSTCWSRLAFLPQPQCLRCGHPDGGRACRFCERLRPFVRSARSVCWLPHEVGSAVVGAFKYAGWTAAAAGIAERMSRLSWPMDVVQERSAIVPVPLAPVRERERGFNQSVLIAQALAARWRIPVWADVLSRTRVTPTQTRLTPADRSANVVGAFSVPVALSGARSRFRGRHLVLLDDVLTTGSTLNACAAALFDAGARTVSYVTFGRARASGDQ